MVLIWRKSADPHLLTLPGFLRQRLLKAAYKKEYDYITKGTIIRSRATWYEKGENNNKYFLNLENSKKTKSTIRKLELKDSKSTTNPKRIIGELFLFILIFTMSLFQLRKGSIRSLS